MKQPTIYNDDYVDYDNVKAAPTSTQNAEAAVTVDESILKILGPAASKSWFEESGGYFQTYVIWVLETLLTNYLT